MVSLANPYTSPQNKREGKKLARCIKDRKMCTDRPDALETLVEPVPDGEFGQTLHITHNRIGEKAKS
jgi:hypothetical protein